MGVILQWVGGAVLVIGVWVLLMAALLRLLGARTQAELAEGLDPWAETDTGLYVHEWNERTRRFDWRKTEGDQQ